MTVTTSRQVRLEDKYELRDGEVYLSGLQALVRIPIDQRRLDRRRGLDTSVFISGYEGSPLAGYDLELDRQRDLLSAHNAVVKPNVNEELGANAVQGSQLASTTEMTTDGVVGIWYGKAPGLDRATDALRHGNLGGAAPTGGVLVLVGDDSTAKSSTVPSSSERAMAEIGMTVLAPSDPQDVLDLGLHGIALSRFCGLWSGLKLATNVVDGAATARVRTDQVEPVVPDNHIDGAAYRHQVTANYIQPTLSELERSLSYQRPQLALRYARANKLNRIEGDADARVGVVTAGATYLDVRQALGRIGIDDGNLDGSGIRVLKLGMISPLEPQIVTEFASGLDEIVVVEEKQPFTELAVKNVLYGHPDAPRISGKHDPAGLPLLRADSDLPPHLISEALTRRLADHPRLRSGLSAPPEPQAQPTTRSLLPLVTRTPYFCSGCPHNSSIGTPDGSLVGAGIGCSALAAFMSEDHVGDIVGLCQMGGEGAAWIGMEPFVKAEHLIQNIGDGTFHHSGSLAIRAAVAAGANMTYKLLYNDAVAMTGGQEAAGRMPIPDVVTELLAEGVKKVVVTTDDVRRYRRIRLPRGVDVRSRDRLLETQQELAAIRGVTVLIHDQECATELRRKRKRGLTPEPDQRVFINERVCEGCGDCGEKSNCLSVQPVETEFGRKTQIHQASCNKDFSCLEGDCPSFVTVRGGASRERTSTATTLDNDELPEPNTTFTSTDFNIRITGIGGTGVVTVAQVISTAATIDGLYVRSLDQMGMAQKGGAVVSDIRLSWNPIDGANKLGPDQCDLYFGCDPLVAAEEKNLAVASAERSRVVLSTSEVPTGSMVANTEIAFPDVSGIIDQLGDVSSQPVRSLDARRLSTRLFGDDQYANVLLVGVALQAGALPINVQALETALRLNGVAVDKNLQALRRGRQFVADPDAFNAALPADDGPNRDPSRLAREIGGTVNAAPKSDLVQLVTDRVDDLIEYQNAAYARRYATLVEEARQLEDRLTDSDLSVTHAFAWNLHKLMAYKDEYEVARLYLAPEFSDRMRSTFGSEARYSIKLHPPVLRALGMRKKISVGRWFRPAFGLLRVMRHLRGTWFDPFGAAKVRRVERALIDEYADTIISTLEELTPEGVDAARQLAELPDVIRGYEEIKLRNVETYRTKRAELIRRFQLTDGDA